MMKKRWKRGGALLLALTLALSGTGILKTRAAVAVDVDLKTETLSLVVSAKAFDDSGSLLVKGDETRAPERMLEDLVVKLYKVATVSESGTFTATDNFSNMDVSSVAPGSGSAEIWNQRAEDAFEMLSADDTADHTGSIDLDGGSYTVTFSSEDVNPLETGLYLIVPEAADSNYCTYTFAPSLVSLPDNEFYETESDAWIYDVKVSLKPEKTPRYGSLKIIKDLVNQNTTFGDETTFIFRIDIDPIIGEDSQKMAALNFNAVGTDQVVVDSIPAGALVTVTEVYSGAGYQLAAGSSPTQQAPVIEADNVVSVSFQNESSGSATGGYGVINSFGLDGNNNYEYNVGYAGSAQPTE